MFSKSKSKILIPLTLLTLLLTGFLLAGDTYNTSTPEPTMYSIEDIYALIDGTTAPTKTLSPTASYNPSMHSISELYVKLANLIQAEDLAPDTTYLGVTAGTSEDTPDPVEDIIKEFNPTSSANTTTGFTLDDIYNLITENTRPTVPNPERSFTPASTPASTMYSLNDIYSELSNLITDPATIATGTTYLGVTGTYEEIPPIVCGSPLVDDRDGKSYATVLIGEQCWMQENLNVGTMVLGTATQGTSPVSIDKYCYNDDEAICNTDGGLYQWNQAMAGSTTAGAQGICPTDWHIPTHDEFTTLEREVCTSGTCETDFPYDTTATSWRGTDEGSKLSSLTWGGTNSSGFTGIPSGYRAYSGLFYNRSSYPYFWSSDAWKRVLSTHSQILRGSGNKDEGYSIRCLKN